METKLNNLSFHIKDHVYRNIFGKYFYDLMETSQFNLINGVSGVVINKIKPNLFLEDDRFITDYDKKYGLKLSSKSHKYSDIMSQDCDYTIFISFLHDKTKTCEISFSNTLNIHIKFYPRYLSLLRIN